MILLVLGAIIAAPVLLIIIYGFNIPQRFKLRKLPGPKPSWLFGNMRGYQSKGPGQSHIVFQEWKKQYGPIYKYFLGHVAYVVVSDPALIQQICTRRFMQFHDRGDVIATTGDARIVEFQNRGLLFAKGKFWAGIRATCEPMFHRSTLQGYAPMMEVAVKEMVDRVAPLADTDQGVDMSVILADMSMDIIGQTIFGIDVKCQKPEERSEVVNHARHLFRPYGGMAPWVALLSFIAPAARPLWYILGSIFEKQKVDEVARAFSYIWGTTFTLLQNGMRAEDKNAKKLEPPLATPGFTAAQEFFKNEVPPPKSFTQLLRKCNNKATGEPLSEMDISAQAFTMLLAGYETTALSLSFAFYFLAKYPDIQRKVLAEVDAFGRSKDLDFSDLESFKYTDAFFKETLRVFPPVTPQVALKREAGANAAIGDFAVPEGTRIQFNVWDMHHNPEYFPDPDSFRPERFMEDVPEVAEDYAKYKPRHQYAYIPFGAGAHKCIGYRFAQEEAVIALVKFLQRYEVQLDPEHHTGDLALVSSITITPRDNIWVKIYRRK